MKLFTVLLGWLVGLGLALFITVAIMENKLMFTSERTEVMYWPRDQVREVCGDRDSCNTGKYRFHSIEDIPDLRKSLKNPIADNPQQEM